MTVEVTVRRVVTAGEEEFDSNVVLLARDRVSEVKPRVVELLELVDE